MCVIEIGVSHLLLQNRWCFSSDVVVVVGFLHCIMFQTKNCAYHAPERKQQQQQQTNDKNMSFFCARCLQRYQCITNMVKSEQVKERWGNCKWHNSAITMPMEAHLEEGSGIIAFETTKVKLTLFVYCANAYEQNIAIKMRLV